MDTLPHLLRRPVPRTGLVQSRSPATVAAYRTRYEGMVRTLESTWQETGYGPFDVAIDLVQRAPGLRRASVRQYRAAILQHLRDLWDRGAIDEDEIKTVVDMLDTAKGMTPADARRATSFRTSAGRRKSASRSEISTVAADVAHRRSSVAQITADMLQLGILVGARPGELFSLFRAPDESFWVRSAKFSIWNGRGLDTIRKLDLSLLGQDLRKRLDSLMLAIRALLAGGATADQLLRRCQALLRRVKAGYGVRVRRICLYTARQQCAANWKARGAGPAELAVLMGHASTDTATRHYARESAGWRDCIAQPLPPVDPELVAKVRRPDRFATAPFRQERSAGYDYKP